MPRPSARRLNAPCLSGRCLPCFSLSLLAGPDLAVPAEPRRAPPSQSLPSRDLPCTACCALRDPAEPVAAGTGLAMPAAPRRAKLGLAWPRLAPLRNACCAEPCLAWTKLAQPRPNEPIFSAPARPVRANLRLDFLRDASTDRASPAQLRSPTLIRAQRYGAPTSLSLPTTPPESIIRPLRVIFARPL